MDAPDISEILEKELKQIESSRSLRLDPNESRPAAADSMIGLAFSGGGIRSASFNLGVLQALAKARLLRSFDYISTVSGGGYIGSWLMGWMHHQQCGVKRIEKYLAGNERTPRTERPEVHFLRDYSNYLTPRRGLMSVDFWAFVGTYLRNTLLNQLILVLFLLTLLLVPWSILAVLHFLESTENSLPSWGANGWLHDYWSSQYFALVVGIVFGLMAVVFMGLNLVVLSPGEKKEKKKKKEEKKEENIEYPWFAQQKWVQWVIVLPLFLAAGMLTYGFEGLLTDFPILQHPYWAVPLLGIALYAGPWSVALIVRRIYWAKTRTGTIQPPEWVILVTAVLTGALVGMLFLPFSRLLMSPEQVLYPNWRVLTFGTPVFVSIMLLAGAIHIGLLGREMHDGKREWWARLGAWLGIYSAFWLFLYLVSVYFPPELGKLLARGSGGKTVTLMGTVTWIASTMYGVLFGKSSKTLDLLPDASRREKLLTYVARITPYLFILGFVLILTLIAAAIGRWLAGIPGSILGPLDERLFDTWQVLLTGAIFFVGALLLSWRVDVNEFSVHYLYRNRLVRCYLGASIEGRQAQPFTGFSDGDDVPLASLAIPENPVAHIDDRPLPILNTSLNVVRGKELALQTRKARSFMFTPSYVGFTRQIPGTNCSESIFAETALLGSSRPNSPNGVRLGTAMAISGAAASPNMGSYSEPALAFLMTLFDVRLGWWLANPKGSAKRWALGSPNFGFYWLISELLGATTDESEYLYLSDGGHFENLGIYELVRRRCKLIVAADASCDAGCACTDLHNAIERCRTDFGIEIELKADEIGKLKPGGEPPRAAAHYAIGAIHYTPGNTAGDGALIYLKPALVATDSVDILGYGKQNAEFPHDTTSNQWFDELRFENYRALGEATGRCTIEIIRSEITRCLAGLPEAASLVPSTA